MLVPYQEIHALGFPNSPRKLGLYEKPWACISWYGPCTQLVNSNYQLGLCLVSYTANAYSIYHFCITIKDFSISFSRVIIVQDFETVTLMCYLYTSRHSLLFSVELKGCAFQVISIVFSFYTFPQPNLSVL